MNSLNKSTESLLRELELESLIREELNDVILYFDYKTDVDYRLILSIITISKNHGEKFLFHRITAQDKLDCLENMLDYIRSDYKSNSLNYEIIWHKKGEHIDIKSWFCGKSFLNIMEKFFFLKDTQEIIIFNVNLKPSA